MDLTLTGKRAFIGGASRGLGFACAQALAAEGCLLALASRSEPNLQKAVAALGSASDILPIVADLSTPEGIRACFEKLDAWGPVDILVNNTGGPPPGRSFEHDEKVWQRAYESLLLYVKRMCDHFVPGMRERKWGRVITISSYAVKEPIEHLVLSNVFRTGLTAYLKVLAKKSRPTASPSTPSSPAPIVPPATRNSSRRRRNGPARTRRPSPRNSSRACRRNGSSARRNSAPSSPSSPPRSPPPSTARPSPPTAACCRDS